MAEKDIKSGEQRILDLDRRFTGSRTVASPEAILTSRRFKPSTKVKLLMQHYNWKEEDAIAAVEKATKEVGFRRGTEGGSHLMGTHSYSQMVKKED